MLEQFPKDQLLEFLRNFVSYFAPFLGVTKGNGFQEGASDVFKMVVGLLVVAGITGGITSAAVTFTLQDSFDNLEARIERIDERHTERLEDLEEEQDVQDDEIEELKP